VESKLAGFESYPQNWIPYNNNNFSTK